MNRKRLATLTILLGLSLPASALAQPFDAGPAITAPAEVDLREPAPDSELIAPEFAAIEAAAPEEVAAPDLEDGAELAGRVVQDVRAGDWRYAVAGLLALVMLGLAKARDETKWFSGDRAGALLVLGLGVGGGIVTALYAPGPLDWRVMAGSVGTAAMAAGIHNLIKRIFWPKDKTQASE